MRRRLRTIVVASFASLVLAACADDAPRRLVEQLDAPTSTERDAAADQLVRIGPAAVHELCLRTYRTSVHRDRAIGVLRAIGPAAKDAIPWLAGVLEDDDRLRPSAARALAAIGSDALPTLLRVVEEGRDMEAREQAALALSSFPRKELASMEPSLRRCVAVDRSGLARAAIAEALGAASGGGRETIDALVALVERDGERTRWAAARALGGLEPAGVEALERLAGSPNEDVRAFAAGGFSAVEPLPTRQTAVLLRLLRDASPHVRRVAANELACAPQGSREAIDALEAAAERWEREGDARGASAARASARTVTSGPARDEVIDDK